MRKLERERKGRESVTLSCQSLPVFVSRMSIHLTRGQLLTWTPSPTFEKNGQKCVRRCPRCRRFRRRRRCFRRRRRRRRCRRRRLFHCRSPKNFEAFGEEKSFYAKKLL